MVRLTSLFGSWRGISRQARAKRRSRQAAWRPRGRWRILSLEMLEDRSLPSFIAPLNFDAGGSPVGMVVADLTGNHRDDVVTINDGETLSVLRGNGDGTFQPARTIMTSDVPLDAVAVGDINGDHIPDLIVTSGSDDQSPGSVEVLLGNGDGTFRAGPTYAVGASPKAIAVADLNGDGKLDIVTANSMSNTVSVLLGNGDGTFQPARNFATEQNPEAVAVGDFNGDHKPDLVVASTDRGTVDVLLGNGDGTFQAYQSFNVGTQPVAVAVGDFNGDGQLDLAVARGVFVDGTLSVLLGNGDGTFQPPVAYNVGANASSVVVGDFNGDGSPDLAVTDAGSGNVYVLQNNGDGSFQAPRPYASGDYPVAVAVQDLNGDGVLDLIVANRFSNDVAVRLGNGDGSFPAAPTYAAGVAPDAVAVGDVNGDGIPDIVVANNPNSLVMGSVSVLLGNGDGTFQPPQTFPTGFGPTSVTLMDVNGDGILDIVTANAGRRGQGHTVSVLLGNGDGTFQPAQDFEAGMGPKFVQAADLNGDGFPDLVVVSTGFPLPSNTISVLLNNGDGTFQAPQTYTVGAGPNSVVIGDFNGDGIPDLAVANSGRAGDRGNVSVLLGNGDGTFQPAQNYAADNSPNSISLADFNGDGIMDLVVTSFGTVAVLLGNGDGTFQAPRDSPAGDTITSLIAGDFTGDGIPDVVITNSSGLRLLVGNGDGTFQPPRAIYGGNGFFLAQGDFNGDGFPDVVAAAFNDNKVTVFLNAGDGGGAPIPGGHTPGAARHVHHHDAFGGLATALSLPRAEEERAPSATAAVAAITTNPPPMGIMLVRNVAPAAEDGRLAGSRQRAESPPVGDGWLHLARLDLELRDAVFAGTLS